MMSLWKTNNEFDLTDTFEDAPRGIDGLPPKGVGVIFNTKMVIKQPEETELDSYITQLCRAVLSDTNVELEYSFIHPFQKMTNETVKKQIPKMTLLLCLKETEEINPIIVSEIEPDKYKYKELNEINTLQFIPFKKDHLIALKNSYFGFLKTDEKSVILKINIWNKNTVVEIDRFILPLCTFKTPTSSAVMSEQGVNGCALLMRNCLNEKWSLLPLNYVFTNIEQKIKNNDLIEHILYGKTTDGEQSSIIAKIKQEEVLTVQYQKTDKIDENTEILWKDRYGDFVKYLSPFYGHATMDEENPFNKPKIIQNVFALDVCCWILSETQKQEWKTDLYPPFSKVLNIENIPTISSYLIFASNFWMFQIRDIYGIPDDIPLKIEKIYCCNQQNVKELIDPPSSHFLKMVIALNNEFKNGAFYFQEEPENKNVLKRSDAIVYNGLKTVVYEPVEADNKYFLIVLIDLAI